MSNGSEGQSAPRRRWARKATAAGAALAIGFVSTVVLAEWLATGAGEGYARALDVEALTTETVTVTGDLYPGGTGDLTVRITNPNPFPTTVSSVVGNGAVTSDVPACDAAGHGVTFTDQTGLALAVPASSSATHVLAGSVAMASTSADECRGALFTVPVALNGGSSTGGGDVTSCDDGDPNTTDYLDSNGVCQNEVLTDPCNGGTWDNSAGGGGTCTYLPLYADADGDGYGDPDVVHEQSSAHDLAPAGYVSNNLDCDDSDPAVNPGATEVPGNGIDDDCDGVVD